LAVKIKYNGESGMFIPDSEWKTFITKVESLNEKNEALEEKNEALEQEVEKARGEQKYKLKKLSQIIERKDKQLEALRSKQEG
jgi:predicted RNase H-like nuclease (RuvC/YqgF family)